MMLLRVYQLQTWIAILLIVMIHCTAIESGSSVVNCRCGSKPWHSRDPTSIKPTEQCCEGFVRSGEGIMQQSKSQCHILNEFTYKGFHSCCVSLMHNAYCAMQKTRHPNDAKQSSQDRWKRYEKLFASSLYGR